MAGASYLIAIGSNRRGRHGAPADEVRAAIAALNARVASPIIASAPVGPSIRRFANAVAIVDSDESPPDMLARCKAVERAFGRRRGRRWGARVIDCDIVLWTGGVWRSRTLTIPHPRLPERDFVLGPAMMIAARWRDSGSGLTLRHLAARLTRRAPIPNRALARR